MLIEIKAASLNFPDLLIVQNKYQMGKPTPAICARLGSTQAWWQPWAMGSRI